MTASHMSSPELVRPSPGKWMELLPCSMARQDAEAGVASGAARVRSEETNSAGTVSEGSGHDLLVRDRTNLVVKRKEN